MPTSIHTYQKYLNPSGDPVILWDFFFSLLTIQGYYLIALIQNNRFLFRLFVIVCQWYVTEISIVITLKMFEHVKENYKRELEKLYNVHIQYTHW
jgi:hypothetical protein